MRSRTFSNCAWLLDRIIIMLKITKQKTIVNKQDRIIQCRYMYVHVQCVYRKAFYMYVKSSYRLCEPGLIIRCIIADRSTKIKLMSSCRDSFGSLPIAIAVCTSSRLIKALVCIVFRHRSQVSPPYHMNRSMSCLHHHPRRLPSA